MNRSEFIVILWLFHFTAIWEKSQLLNGHQTNFQFLTPKIANMQSIKIISGKIKNKDFCDYSFEEKTEAGAQTVNVSSDAIIHDDMRAKFKQLVPHLAYICEEIDPAKNELEDAMDDINSLLDGSKLKGKLSYYKVTAFKLSGSGDGEGVTITGQKKLQSGKVVNFNTPFIRWEDEYEFIHELRVAITECQEEITQYMDGKKAPDTQLALFDDDMDVIDAVEESENEAI